MSFDLPPRSQVGYLDPEIAGEGQKVIGEVGQQLILSDGEQITYEVLPPKVVMPDLSSVKSLSRYFNRRGYQVYPAWLYHPIEQPRLVKTAQEAAALGIRYRQATQ